jgi:hypothetical protein
MLIGSSYSKRSAAVTFEGLLREPAGTGQGDNQPVGDIAA